MKNTKTVFKTIDQYIAASPKEVRELLKSLRQTIRAAAPQAEERISYRMPAFYLKGYLVYFAAFTKHIGLYPTASGVSAFKNKLSGYQHTKGAIQFPLDRPLPLKLIRDIVKFRVKENLCEN